MKTLKTLLVAALFLPILHATTSFAQSTFDAKKKQASSVNTSSLKASKGAHPIAKSTTRSFQPVVLNRQSLRISYAAETGLPSFIQSPRTASATGTASRYDMQNACIAYLEELKPHLRMASPSVDFIIRTAKSKGENKTVIRLDQRYKGVLIYGAEVIVHLNAAGQGESFNGSYFNVDKNIDVVPVLSQHAALDKIRQSQSNPWRTLSNIERKLVQYAEPEIALCLYREKALVTSFVLAYHIIACRSVQQRWEYFVDATTGRIIHQFQSTCFVDGPRTANALDLNGVSKSINTYQVGSTFFMLDGSRPMFNGPASTLPDDPVGGILTIDQNNTFGDNTAFQHVVSANNAWNNPKAVSAHVNAGAVYDYFKSKFGRNSIDDNGATMFSMINVPDENGQPLDNAFWNGKFMSYGNGNVAFKPLAGAVDVAGHEITHGIVQNTANLEYQGESGAINESMADIFGTMLDPSDWLIGEDVVKLSAFPSGALRSLSDPHNGGTSLADPGFQPKHTNEAFNGTQDNGGVHINSGIPNNAFFRFAEATTRDKAAAAFYKALDEYLTKSSKFIDLRLAVIKAAGDLYGTTSNEVTQAGIAFDAVGIASGTGGNFNPTLPANPGTEFLLILNTDATDANTLYRTPSNASSFAPLSTTAFKSRASITDDGTIAVFVGSDSKIHAIHTAPGSSPSESILQNEAIWSNVVVSKGGTKMAAVTSAEDGKIYVYSFQEQSWHEFELYNPTFTEGIVSGGPVYADALEWDYPGEVLIYDCFNRVQNSNGEAIEYWDVNFIKVWDNQNNAFAEGTIEKLFSSLPDGVSIGNPSFSKNSPNVIAFDYFAFVDDEYAVLGCNIETNEVNVLSVNSSLGYPTFNKDDTRVGFSTFDGSAFSINTVLLNADKISASGSPVGLITDAKWPVYFATGERETGDDVVTGILEPPALQHSAMSCYPTSFVSTFAVELDQSISADSHIEVVNTLGQRVFVSGATSGREKMVLDLENVSAGFYIVRVANGGKGESCKVLKR